MEAYTTCPSCGQVEHVAEARSMCLRDITMFETKFELPLWYGTVGCRTTNLETQGVYAQLIYLVDVEIIPILPE